MEQKEEAYKLNLFCFTVTLKLAGNNLRTRWYLQILNTCLLIRNNIKTLVSLLLHKNRINIYNHKITIFILNPYLETIYMFCKFACTKR